MLHQSVSRAIAALAIVLAACSARQPQRATPGVAEMPADSAHAGHAAEMPDTAAHVIHAPQMPDTAAHAAHAARAPDTAAHAAHAAEMPDTAAHAAVAAHRMWMHTLGNGWSAMGMAQAFPIVSTGLRAAAEDSPLDGTAVYLTQPALMFNIESPGSRFVVRTTLNFEGVTQPDGELTFGGWGEGFIDKRHPHTLLHELMLSVNFWNVTGGALSFSAGKGFAPYGTDDPMARPAVKYPTNHHLSQILERWTVNGAYMNRGWSIEAGAFGGAEPDGPYDFSNIESFPDSWSARIARRFGRGAGVMAEWEAAASYGHVREEHDGEAATTALYNVALRHERPYDFGSLYGLVEGSLSEPDEGDGFFSILGEARIAVERHQPYYRIEYATRPEYDRAGPPGTDGSFRYDHDAHPVGATRWLINTVGYGYGLTDYPFSARPFVEIQHSRVSAERGAVDPEALFGARTFWRLSAGFRLFLGGGPMRMGSYGVLDPMTSMHPGDMSASDHTEHP